jgi:hypothetical protein
MRHGEVLPHQLPCASGGTCLRLETKKKEKLNLFGFLFLIKKVVFPIFFPFFHLFYILFLINIP